MSVSTDAVPSTAPIDDDVLAAAEAATGFLPANEARALHAAATVAAPLGPVVEIGSYCGKSTIYLAEAARRAGQVVVTLDHHRGSEEQQPGWEWHDPTLVDPATGRMDTLPHLRRNLEVAGVEESVVVVVTRSEVLGRLWATAAGMVFIDGSHTDEAAQRDYETWAPHVVEGGLLVIHDVFPDPTDGGQAPYRIYRRALDSGAFAEVGVTDSLRVLRRVGGGF